MAAFQRYRDGDGRTNTMIARNDPPPPLGSQQVRASDDMAILNSPKELLLRVDQFRCEVKGITGDSRHEGWARIVAELKGMMRSRVEALYGSEGIAFPFAGRLLTDAEGHFNLTGSSTIKHFDHTHFVPISSEEEFTRFLQTSLAMCSSCGSLVAMLHGADPRHETVFDVGVTLQIEKCLHDVDSGHPVYPLAAHM